MAALILPSRLKKQPQQAAQVDWSNPLNRGTTGLWSLNNGFYVRDLVSGIVGGFSDSSANFLSSASLDGVGLGAAVSSTTVRGIVTNVLASSLGISGANDRTVFGVAVYDTNAGNEALFTLGTPSSGNQDWSLRRYTVSANWRFNIYGVIGLDFNYVPPADNRINYVCTQNGTTVEVWINGLMVATTVAAINTTDAIFKIGGDTVLWPAWNAPILFTGAANRAWSTSEKLKFFDNPWQLFQAPRRRLWLASGIASPAVLQAAGISTSAGTASLSTSIPVAASGASPSTGIASLATAIPVNAAGISASIGSAALTTSVALAASGISSSAGTAALSTQIPLNAVGTSPSVGSATLTAASALAAAGTSPSNGSAALSTQIALSAIGTSASLSAAALTAPGQGLNASGVSTSVGSSSLSTAITISSAGSAPSSGSAALTTSIALAAAAISQASGSAALTSTIALAAIATASSSASAALSTAIALQAAGISASQGTAAFAASNPLSASGTSQSIATAQLTTLIALSVASVSSSITVASLFTAGPLSINPARMYLGQNRITAIVGSTRIRKI